MRTLNQKQLQKRDYILQKNYIFIHINKCGGGAIEAALGLPRLHMTAAEYIHFWVARDGTAFLAFLSSEIHGIKSSLIITTE